MPLTHAQFIAKGHGKTAPWMDLVNSEEWDTFGRRTDWLDEPSWLPFFLAQWHFASPRGERLPAHKFRALRRALRRSCEAIVAGRTVPPTALRIINDGLGVMGTHQLFRQGNTLQLEFVGLSKSWEWVLAQTALSFARVLADGDLARVKICQNTDCRWVFYDATKARSRRWCSDKVCGNRERVRRARARISR